MPNLWDYEKKEEKQLTKTEIPTVEKVSWKDSGLKADSLPEELKVIKKRSGEYPGILEGGRRLRSIRL